LPASTAGVKGPGLIVTVGGLRGQTPARTWASVTDKPRAGRERTRPRELAGQRARPARAHRRAQRGLERGAGCDPRAQHHDREPGLDRRRRGRGLAHRAVRLREPRGRHGRRRAGRRGLRHPQLVARAPPRRSRLTGRPHSSRMPGGRNPRGVAAGLPTPQWDSNWDVPAAMSMTCPIHVTECSPLVGTGTAVLQGHAHAAAARIRVTPDARVN
jgi:hypothetical protein